MKKKHYSFCAVVPAYNEKATIGSVLEAIVHSRAFKDIIVVDDGSTDGTHTAASVPGVRVIRQANAGKTRAMRAGAFAAHSSHIVFFDADLSGLSIAHIFDLIRPVEHGADMTIGIRDRGPFLNLLMRTILPRISGERCIGKKDFLAASANVVGFGIESAMNAAIRKKKGRVVLVGLRGVGHTIKEKKYGFLPGLKARLRMIYEVVCAELK